MPAWTRGATSTASAYGDVTQPGSRRFLRHRSRLARETAVLHLETSVQRVAHLVLNASALADRMEERPSSGVHEARERRARVKVLRDAARAGQEALRRSTAHLEGDREALQPDPPPAAP